MPLPTPLSAVTQANIERLVADREQEGPYLDLKRELPQNWDSSAKHEFLADITAFASAGGGDLIYGVDEDGEGRATALIPQTANADIEARRLQDLLLNSVDPRIPASEVAAVPVVVNGVAGNIFVVRVPKSWSGPHRVKTTHHFFLREGARKRQLDVPELRGLILRTATQAERVRDFRANRVSQILTADTPSRLALGAIMVLHLVPTQAALDALALDPVQYAPWATRNARRIPLLAREDDGRVRLSLDGAVSTRYSSSPETDGYSLLFRNGFLEATAVYSHEYPNKPKWISLPSQQFESVCIKVVKAFRAELSYLGVGQEMVALFSLLRADNVIMGIDRFRYGLSDDDGRFDRKHVLLPDVLLAPELPAEQAMRPVFDLVWQAAGMAKSLNYNDAGEWSPKG